jgi:hypothetical protein
MKLSIFSCLTMLRKAKNLNRLDDLVRKERSGWSAGVKGKGSASRRWQICSRNSPRAKLSAKQPWYRPAGGGNGRACVQQSEPKSPPESLGSYVSGNQIFISARGCRGRRAPEKNLVIPGDRISPWRQRASTCHLDCLLRHQGSKIVARRATTLVDSKLDHRTSESPEHCNPER